MVRETLTTLFQQNEGWFAGHTAFRNGTHGDGWLEKGAIIREVSRLDIVAEAQAAMIQDRFPEAEFLIGTGECGAVVVAAVARYLKLPIALTIPENAKLYFHRMNDPKTGQRAVMVEDLIFSGTDVRRHIEFLPTVGVELLGVSVWVNRQSEVINGIPILSLMPPPFSIFLADDCPLCHSGVPVEYFEIRE